MIVSFGNRSSDPRIRGCPTMMSYVFQYIRKQKQGYFYQKYISVQRWRHCLRTPWKSRLHDLSGMEIGIGRHAVSCSHRAEECGQPTERWWLVPDPAVHQLQISRPGLIHHHHHALLCTAVSIFSLRYLYNASSSGLVATCWLQKCFNIRICEISNVRIGWMDPPTKQVKTLACLKMLKQRTPANR